VLLKESLLSLSLNHYLILAAILFGIGMLGLMLRRNVVVVLMCIELMLNAVNLTFVAYSHYLARMEGQVIAFFVMTVAAAEAAVGLAIIVAILRRFKEVNIRFFEHLRG
jgi:NADH-quinone oxidoreductase subunit K